MSCNCKHEKENIERFYKFISEFREYFIKRMTCDSETDDARRKDYNQAIFFYDSLYGEHVACFSDTSMEMVLKCFDDAIKDYRRTFCDVENCRRK